MIDVCDLLSIMNQAEYNKVNNIDLFGFITRELPIPAYLKYSPLEEGQTLVEVKIFGVHFKANDVARLFHGDGNAKQMYFCNGNMATCIDSNKLKTQYQAPDSRWLTFSGRLSMPKGGLNVVNMFKFKKSASGWLVGEPDINDIDVDVWDNTGRMFTYLMQSAERGSFFQPDDINKYAPCKSIADGTKIKTARSAPVEPTPNPVSVSGLTADEAPVPVTPLSKEDKEEEEKINEAVRAREIAKVSADKLAKTDNTGIRFELLKQSPSYGVMYDMLETATEYRCAYLDKFSEIYSIDEDDVSEPILNLFEKIKLHWNNKPSPRSRTGKGLVKDYMERSGISTSQEYLGSTVEKYLLSLGTSLIDYSLGRCDLEATKEASEAGSQLFGSNERLYAGLLGLITGVSVTDLMNASAKCAKNKISFSKLVNKNPYSLTLVSNLRFKDIETIALCMGYATKPEVKRGKNIGVLYDYTLNCEGGSTVYARKDIYVRGLGVELTRGDYNKVQTSGTYLSMYRQEELVSYVDSSLTKSDWSYPKTGWKYNRSEMVYCLSLAKVDIDKAVQDFISTGVGVETKLNGDSWICNTTHLRKELFIYNKLYELAKRKMPYDMGEIDSAIAEFEEKKGFTLEERQRDAVRLVGFGAGAVTGPAGSGKTTVSEAMVYALEKQKKSIKIQYGAPTGKASKRLQEVVGAPVKTMHSMFGIGLGGEDNLFDDNGEIDNARKDPDVYFFDEDAMVTVDLMYSVLSKINRAQVFFLGDIEQLPPIGKGVPFKNMLGFLPYVALNVSKRSAEGSGITNNAKTIIYNSDEKNWKPLENSNDFRLLECADDEIAEVVKDLCSWHLGKTQVRPEGAVDGVFEPDDIQVVSPVSTVTYPWATKPVNKDLQNIFNPHVYGQSFVYGIGGKPVCSYRIGDRVIHTSNDYSMQHYVSWQGGLLHKAQSQGVMNGDVGKIVGILHSMSCQYFEPDESEPESKSKVEKRDDTKWLGENKYFIVVKYYNFETNKDIFILYQVSIDTKSSIETERVFAGYDLSTLQLAYSLTVHKMQGSQGKLIIITLGAIKRAGFVTRNMIYTAITRGEDLVYVVGNVGNNQNSALSIARKQVATDGVVTIMDILLTQSVA